MNNKNFAFAGAALLFVGLFMPIVSLPIVGNVNLFNNGSNITAIGIAVLAGIALALAVKDRLRDLIWPGAAAAAVLAYVFVRLQYGMMQMREQVSSQLQDNPFAGLAQAALGSVQLQWGWLVLGAGAGLLLYAGFSARKEEAAEFEGADGTTKAVIGLSAILLLIAPAMDLIGGSLLARSQSSAARQADGQLTGAPAVTAESSGADARERAAYITQHLRLYEVETRYYDSILDGRVPGVRFKIQNNGTRTLNRVTVRVVFHNAEGNAISEQEYNPVLVSQYNYGGDNTPLRPNYIWQQDSDRFFVANNVPSEWQTGRATATITDIEFGPDA